MSFTEIQEACRTVEGDLKSYAASENRHFINQHKIVLYDWMCYPTRPPEHILYLISNLLESLQVPDQFDVKDFKFDLATLTLQGIAKRLLVTSNKMILNGAWEAVILCCIKYVNVDLNNRFYFADLPWIADAICSPSLCPNPYMRLEMLTLLWRFSLISGNKEKCCRIFTGFVDTINQVNLEHLYSEEGPDMQCSAKDILQVFTALSCSSYDVTAIGRKIHMQLEDNCFGNEVKFLANSLKLTGKLAKIAESKYRKDGNTLRKCIRRCITLFMHANGLLFDKGTAELYIVCRHPFLLPYATSAISDITDATLSVSSKIHHVPPFSICSSQSKYGKLVERRKNLYRKLMNRRNRLVCDIDLPYKPALPTMLLEREILSTPGGSNEVFKNLVSRYPVLELAFDNKENGDFGISHYNDSEDEYVGL
ncbi:unnamed protein product [Meganyctiphanes norvegica]|uniref:Uncharacterized protein n=1 Tax=Meganyctiphanes norvegica TaxID=48144 RepID=A0AAV2SP17_MEGNR